MRGCVLCTQQKEQERDSKRIKNAQTLKGFLPPPLGFCHSSRSKSVLFPTHFHALHRCARILTGRSLMKSMKSVLFPPSFARISLTGRQASEGAILIRFGMFPFVGRGRSTFCSVVSMDGWMDRGEERNAD